MKTVDVDEKKRIVTGFYNTFNFVDDGNDILLPGCCLRSIVKRGPNGIATGKIKHLLHHDPTQMPGKIIHLEEKKVNGWTGLYFETKMSQTPLGEETLIKYQENIYDSHSIGFNHIPGATAMAEPGTELWDMLLQLVRNPDDMRKRDEVFVITEIDLFEGSTVWLGENSETPFLGVKAKLPEKEMLKYLTANFRL